MSKFLLRNGGQTFKQTLIRHCRNLSGQVVTKDKPLQEQKQDEKINEQAIQTSEKLSQMHTKQNIKKPNRPPFIKNVFLGKFDEEILTYPEALNKERVDKLEQDLRPIQFYFDNSEDATKKEFWESAKQMQLFGMEAPQLSNGRELNLTESLRFTEIIAQKSNDIQLLSNEQAVKVLLQFGNDRQINKYLQDVTAGRITMAWCVNEENECDPEQFTTSASFDANKKQWVLNGRKLNVVNGESADLFVVLAKTTLLATGLNKVNVSALLVERTFGGVSSKPCQTVGLDKTDIAEVTFDNTHVPAENMLGKENQGLYVYSKIVPEINLVTSIASCTIAKNSYNKYFEYCRDTSTDNNNLLDTELVAEKLANFAAKIYAMESMIYLTAGLLDIYQDQDCQMEASITKIFSAEHSSIITSHIMHLIGPDAYQTQHWSNSNHRNALHYLLFNGTPDSTKIIIALQGLQFAGMQLQDLIKRIRNPLFHTKEAFSRMWTQRRHNRDNPRLTLQLHQFLHPTAQPGADCLEYSVLRMQYITELILAQYGMEIVNKHTDVIRLADCVIDIYAMVASLGRASRSYCIGLSHSDYEVLLANAFCQKAMRRVKENVMLIQEGPYVNHDVAYGKLAEKVQQVGGYFPEHPLKRNF